MRLGILFVRLVIIFVKLGTLRVKVGHCVKFGTLCETVDIVSEREDNV